MEARADETLVGLADAWRGAIKQHMGIWRDLKVNKRKTEVDMLVGSIVAMGRERGVLTRVNASTLDVVHEIEDGKRGMGWENLKEISHRAGL